MNVNHQEYFLSPYMLLREMATLCGIERGVCQIYRWYKIEEDAYQTVFWANDHIVDIGTFPNAELTKTLDDFSEKYLQTAAKVWLSRGGQTCPKLALKQGSEFAAEYTMVGPREQVRGPVV